MNCSSMWRLTHIYSKLDILSTDQETACNVRPIVFLTTFLFLLQTAYNMLLQETVEHPSILILLASEHQLINVGVGHFELYLNVPVT